MRRKAVIKRSPPDTSVRALWTAVGRRRSEATFEAAGCRWDLRRRGTSRLGWPASNFLFPLGSSIFIQEISPVATAGSPLLGIVL